MRKPSKDTLIKRFTPLVDTREQLPYRYPNRIVRGLKFGDYSLEYEGKSFEDVIVFERKSSTSELFSATGSQRERFERELEKLAKVEFKCVVCEFDYMRFVNDPPPGILPPSAVYGSICSWYTRFNVPFIFCGNRNNAYNYIWKCMYEFVKHKILEVE